MILFFLSSGLFLGWSLGANDAANVFGSAVGSKMVSFRKAVVVLSLFVILGAVFQGARASHTLGKLGAVKAIAGSFTVAFADVKMVSSIRRNQCGQIVSRQVLSAESREGFIAFESKDKNYKLWLRLIIWSYNFKVEA